jgi:uncharacterized membrane protein
MTPEALAAMGQESLLHERFAGLVAALDWVAVGIDLVAVALMLVGVVRFLADLLRPLRESGKVTSRIDVARVELGRYILAALELLIVSDIIHTSLSLQITDLIYLGMLVLIRSAISFFLSREIREIREGESK